MDGEAMMTAHGESSGDFMDRRARAGVGAMLSTTPRHANMSEQMRAWKVMNPDMSGGGDPENILGERARRYGEPLPFVSTEAIEPFNRVPLECCEAQLAWRMGT